MSAEKNTTQGEEKVQAMLNRWVNMRREMALGELVRRPANPLDVESLHQCQEWRTQTMQEIACFITDIQNASLGHHKVRALNDEINRLVREKSLWEDRIRQLGGPDYKKVTVRQVDSQGQEIPGSEGYLYFGAAKDLPGVREYLQRAPPSKPVATKAALEAKVSQFYFETQENEELLELERQAEKKYLHPSMNINFQDSTLDTVKQANQKHLEELLSS